MIVRLKQLLITTRKTTERLVFSESVTFLYGPVGTGKSTAARLIDYCFGGDLERTPAIQQEFVAVQLSLTSATTVVNWSALPPILRACGSLGPATIRTRALSTPHSTPRKLPYWVTTFIILAICCVFFVASRRSRSESDRATPSRPWCDSVSATSGPSAISTRPIWIPPSFGSRIRSAGGRAKTRCGSSPDCTRSG